MQSKKVISFLIYFFLTQFVFGQDQEWTLNPRALNDTIPMHVFPMNSNFFTSSIYDSYLGHDNYYWISSGKSGLQRVDVNETKYFKRNFPPSYQFDRDSPKKLYHFEDTLYIGTERGFLSYDPTRQKFHHHGEKDLTQLSPYKASTHCLSFISSDTVLVGNKHGLCLFDKKEDRIIKTLWEEDPIKDGAATYNFVRQLEQDIHDPNITWGVGRKGLFKMDKKDWKKEYFPIDDGIALGSLHYYMFDFVQADSAIYVLYFGDIRSTGRAGNQIWKFDLETKEWKKILRLRIWDEQGINHNPMIHSLRRIGDYLMLSARGFGVQLIDLKTDSVHTVYLSHPMAREKDNWKNPERLLDNYLSDLYTAQVDNDGYLWACHRRDYLIKSIEPLFNPKIEEPPRDIIINNLYINGTLVPAIKYQESVKSNRFLLNQRERNISFDFGVVNPPSHEMYYEYKYRSKEWKQPLNKLQVRIEDLKAGNNVVDIRAMIGDKIYQETQFRFYTKPRLHEYWWFQLGLLLFVSGILYSFYKIKRDQIRKEERLKTAFQKQVAEIEMKALRAQMNPHFLFNSLNSIKHYSLTRTKKETSQYVTVFSQLIRQILNNSNEKVVTLAQELNAIKLYVKVEQNRFDKNFDFQLDVDKSINEEALFIPPLILQPYIENAIWHGLMHKKGDRKLSLKIFQADTVLHCEITDNGVGRKAAEEIKKRKEQFKKKSLGTQITSERLQLIEKLFGIKAKVNIIDLVDENAQALGTKIVLEIPRISKETLDSLRTT